MSRPQGNKYYSIDLSPEKSLVKWTADSGVQLFVVSWRNPTAEQRHGGLSEYTMALDRAVDVARRITGGPDVQHVGQLLGRDDAGGLPPRWPSSARARTSRSALRPANTCVRSKALGAGAAHPLQGGVVAGSSGEFVCSGGA